MTQTEALKLALEALEPEFYLAEWYVNEHVIPAAIAAIKTVLAQPEPVATSDTSQERVDETAKQRHEQEPVSYTGNGTAGREADARPTGFFFQADKRKPEQESVAVWELQEDGWDTICDGDWLKTLPVGTKLYTSPPTQRKPLTDEEILHRVDTHVGGPSPSYPLDNSDWLNFARAIEAAHGIKGDA